MSPVDAPPNPFCSECGQPKLSTEMARFGDRLICPDCKSTYAQKLREGVVPVATVTYGGFWIRFLAVLIDGVILWVVDYILGFAILGSGTQRVVANPADFGAAMAKVGAASLIGLIAGCTYETLFIGRMGATPGKMALGLKVIRADGSPVGFARAAGRYFAKILSAIILMIGYIMAGFDSQKRALHDMICDTRVIKTRG